MKTAFCYKLTTNSCHVCAISIKMKLKVFIVVRYLTKKNYLRLHSGIFNEVSYLVHDSLQGLNSVFMNLELHVPSPSKIRVLFVPNATKTHSAK